MILDYFLEICAIPRPSKKEEKICAYLLNFANKHALTAQQDAIGNVLITKPASQGYEHLPTLILQSHVDMVCEKNSGVAHNFDTDPIQVSIDGDWMKAQQTTLGADCGIGMAASLAVLADTSLDHPRLECLFTVDEETGLTGAKHLQTDFLTGTTLINLDSEDDGEIFIGCAGGIDTLIQFRYTPQPIPHNYQAFTCSLSGLLGGHSGDDINKNRQNAILLLNNLLLTMNQAWGMGLHSFNGGNLRNAIPREATAIILIPEMHVPKVDGLIDQFKKSFDAFIDFEPHIKFVMQATTLPDVMMEPCVLTQLLKAIANCPNGVLAMSATVPDFVDTSTNLASIKFDLLGEINLSTSQRSSSSERRDKASQEVERVFVQAGASISRSDGYPGWEPQAESKIANCTVAAYRHLFGTDPQVKAIHAGLECGLFLDKYPHLDMVSFGPTIKGAHSPDERLQLSTVDRFWKLLVCVLATKVVVNG